MTGGFAYVLDENGEFQQDALQSRRASIWSAWTDANDIETLRYWIARHAEETGSPRANWILENWDSHAAEVRQGFPARIQARAGRAAQGIAAQSKVMHG